MYAGKHLRAGLCSLEGEGNVWDEDRFQHTRLGAGFNVQFDLRHVELFSVVGKNVHHCGGFGSNRQPDNTDARSISGHLL